VRHKVLDLVIAQARRSPSKPAVGTTSGDTWSYAELLRRANIVRQIVLTSSSERVVIALDEDKLAASAAVCGLFGDAIVIPARSDLGLSEWTQLVEVVRPTKVIAGEACIEGLANAGFVARRQALAFADRTVFIAFLEQRDAPQLPPSTTLVLRTSGTTGPSPKTVCLTREVVASAVARVSATISVTEDDCCLNVASMAHTLGIITGTLLPLTVGGSALFAAPAELVAVSEWSPSALRPTWCSTVPPVHRILLAQYHDHRSRERLPLRIVRNSAAPLPKDLEDALDAAFGPRFVNAYAMTEAPGEIASTLPGGESRLRGVGTPTSPMRIADEPDGRGCGEVLVRGPLLESAYLHDTGYRPLLASDGWFHTGDIGFIDEDGALHLAGRLSETINCGGEKVNPTAVEARLRLHPLVADAAAVGLDHPSLGQQVAVVVVPRGTGVPSRMDIIEHLKDEFTRAAVPRHVICIDALPYSRNGKLDRRRLEADVADHVAAVRSPRAHAGEAG
jgi:acyl-CoA synthetase (AMP-forming)/AMP-acid ligase II